MFMATSEMRFSPESLELLDRFADQLRDDLAQLAIEKARAQGRERVTEADMSAAIPMAIDHALKLIVVPTAPQP